MRASLALIFFITRRRYLLKVVHGIEGLSIWVGRAFGWCILILTLSVSYEVFMRYVLNSPTVWAFDMMIQMYGALFLMAGPYALAQDTHVRGDVLSQVDLSSLQQRHNLVVPFSGLHQIIFALSKFAVYSFFSDTLRPKIINSCTTYNYCNNHKWGSS
jgi:TRAP-type mannitol/chloroaromatic compound transport system permease small subunit